MLGAATHQASGLSLLQDGAGVVLRIKGENRSVEVNGQTTKVTVESDGRRVCFTRASDGSVAVVISDGGRNEEFKFENEAALKEAKPELHALLEGGRVKVYGESTPADAPTDGNKADFKGGGQSIEEFRRSVERTKQAESGLMADGDLSDNEVGRLSREARERLERDMKRLEEREKENAKERDPRDRAEQSDGITQDRYLASLRALERSLLDRISALKSGLKGADVKSLDDLAGKVKDTYADLRDKILDENKKTWGQTLEKGRRFFDEYTAQIDGWDKKVSGDSKVANPYDDMRDAERRLLRRIKALRRVGGDKYESTLDKFEDKVKDTYADLFDKLKDEGKVAWKAVGEMHEKFSAQMTADLDKLEAQMSSASKPQERPRQPDPKEPETKSDWKDTQSPERDVNLPPGEHADIIGGVRVARLTPLVRKQLNLDNGLSVNEIVNADGALAEAGLEVYDIIIEVNGEKVDTRTELRDAVAGLKKGGELKLTIMRDGKRETLRVKR